MRVGIIILVWSLCALAGCAKKKAAEDKAPAATEQAPVTPEMPKGGAETGAAPGGGGPIGGSAAGSAAGSADGSGEPRARMPSDDGGEAKARVQMPADDGGEAAKKACTKAEDCGANHDCCNGFCFKQGTAKHSIECKLPSGKL